MPLPFQPQHPQNRELTGGDLLAQTLRHLGVEVAFGLHGGHLDAFLIGADEIGIRLVDTRHETTAVQAAEGYAKIAGKVGCCSVTANSGFSNALPGLATALADRSPILCITSSPPLQDAETNALQGFHDQVVVARPLTKFAHRVTTVEEIPRLAAYAFRAANAGVKGPCLLDFPIDVLFAPPQLHRVAYGALAVPPAYAPAPDPAAVDALLKAWKSAKRPAIITGTGASAAGPALTALAEATSTPVFYSGKYSAPMPCDHELRGGPATRLAAFAGGASAPDFVLLLGARTGFLLGGRGGAVIPNADRVLAQVDLDGAEIGRSHAVDIGIVADVALFCDAALQRAAAASDGAEEGKRDAEWIAACRDDGAGASTYDDDPDTMPDGHMHPYKALSAVMRALPADSILILDGGESGQWAAMTAERARPHAVLTATGYLGFLGNGWGYALGAAIADPARQVVSFHGDGSAGFHVQELDTFARFGLRVLTVVANNFVWGMSVNGQDALYGEKVRFRPAVQLSRHCAYEVVAQGFHCEGRKVTELRDVGPTVKELVECGRPGLVNVVVSVKPTTPATQSMVGWTDDPNVIVVPYYDNVPRPFYKDSAASNGSTT